MITRKDQYRYLRNIPFQIDGGIMPLRNTEDKNDLRGEDIAFIKEALLERAVLMNPYKYRPHRSAETISSSIVASDLVGMHRVFVDSFKGISKDASGIDLEAHGTFDDSKHIVHSILQYYPEQQDQGEAEYDLLDSFLRSRVKPKPSLINVSENDSFLASKISDVFAQIDDSRTVFTTQTRTDGESDYCAHYVHSGSISQNYVHYGYTEREGGTIGDYVWQLPDYVRIVLPFTPMLAPHIVEFGIMYNLYFDNDPRGQQHSGGDEYRFVGIYPLTEEYYYIDYYTLQGYLQIELDTEDCRDILLDAIARTGLSPIGRMTISFNRIITRLGLGDHTKW